VTICHSRSADLAAVTRSADILVAAVGQPGLVTADMVKPGAAVVDVGINRVDGRLVGDVDFPAVREVAGAISPVPGGVGPLTVAMLLANTLLAAELRQTRGRRASTFPPLDRVAQRGLPGGCPTLEAAIHALFLSCPP